MSKNFQLLQRIAKDVSFGLPDVVVSLPRKTGSALPSRKELSDTEITKLIQRLFLQSGKDIGPKVVSFSGLATDERSGWICARAGEALAAQVDNSVCIVEANPWSPQSHVLRSVGNQTGLAEALTAKGPIKAFSTFLNGENLWLISSGRVNPNLFISLSRYRERFAELRETFDYILVNAPSFSHEAEATLIGQLTDGIVLIVEANQSRRDTVRRVKEQLDSAQVQILGAVLDQRTFPIPEKLYRKL